MSNKRGQVVPVISRSSNLDRSQGIPPQKARSAAMDSSNSLTSSKLEETVMGILNVNQNASSWQNLCGGNPVNQTGKWFQFVRLLGTVMIPIAALVILVGYIFIERISEHFQNRDVRFKIRYSLELSRMLHKLQIERDMSALYVRRNNTETKELLVNTYQETDNALSSLTLWPKVRLENEEFSLKANFVQYLNKHRYIIDIERRTVRLELTFYEKLMKQFTYWFYDAITEARSGSFWKDLVSLQEIVESREAFGMERALGAMFFAMGGFDSWEDYLLFAEAQDVGDVTLKSAREYSILVERIYTETIKTIDDYMGGIKKMRRLVRHMNLDRIEGSLQNASSWNTNMTVYLDALLVMQDELSEIILASLRKSERSDEETIIIVAVLFATVVFMCPLILNALYTLTTKMQVFPVMLANRIREIADEKERSELMFYQMLPRSVAEQLKGNVTIQAENYSEVTVLVSNLVDFSYIYSRSSPIQVIEMVNHLYSTLDAQTKNHDVYRVEMMSDAYAVTSGVPCRNGKKHASVVASFALHMRNLINQLEIKHLKGRTFNLRIGIHTGPVVAGVVEKQVPDYCLFGPTVHTAIAMEISGESGYIHISAATNSILQEIGGFMTKKCNENKSATNGKPTYWLQSRIKNNKMNISDKEYNEYLKDIEEIKQDDGGIWSIPEVE